MAKKEQKKSKQKKGPPNPQPRQMASQMPGGPEGQGQEPNGHSPEWNRMYQELLAKGYSPEDAEREADAMEYRMSQQGEGG